MLCRGPEDLPRAKSRALGKDALCRGPDTRALGKERPSAKRPLPRVRPSAKRGPRQRCPRQIRPVGSRWPFPVKLCRGPPVRTSAKVFFSVKPAFLANFFIFKSRPSAKIFLKPVFWPNFFFINRLCRGPQARPSAKKPFAEGQARPSAKIFFLVF